jgi:DNA mismatch endonuclease, patch repair protein
MKRSQEITYKIMSSIHSKNTKPEITFRKALWHEGVRYRIHVPVFGKPDIAIKKYRIAIFIDGDFWHGNNWKLRKEKSLENELKHYSLFWKKKIKRNVERDIEVNKQLKKDKWCVLRFWQSDIESNLNKCIKKTIKAIEGRKESSCLDHSARR